MPKIAYKNSIYKSVQQVVRERWERDDQEGEAGPTEAQSRAVGGWRLWLIQQMSHKNTKITALKNFLSKECNW